jgi:hypothetical protein
MGTKIDVFFVTGIDKELDKKLSAKGYKNRGLVIRIYCYIIFKTDSGWTKPFPAIIDTGAHTSLIPFDIWSTCKTNILVDHYVKGLVPKEECKIDVKVGELSGVLVDRKNLSKEYRFLSYFAPTNEVPLILGLKELLSKFKLFIDYKNNTAWLEEA